MDALVGTYNLNDGTVYEVTDPGITPVKGKKNYYAKCVKAETKETGTGFLIEQRLLERNIATGSWEKS